MTQLEEIITELIDDKIELTQIAQAFEQDLVAQRITPEQAQDLVDAVVPTLELLGASSGQTKTDLGPVLALLTPEVIVALQLLGFNFRKAIGEPLTQLLADFLSCRRLHPTPSRTRGSSSRSNSPQSIVDKLQHIASPPGDLPWDRMRSASRASRADLALTVTRVTSVGV